MPPLEQCLITAATPTRLLPYYHVRRLPTGIYAVAHWIPGTNTAHVDAETTSVMGAMRLAADMEAAKRSADGWHA
jgi:hypothetical protein